MKTLTINLLKHTMKKITHWDAVIRMKDSSEEETVTIKVDKDFDIEMATPQEIKDDEDIFFYIDTPEEIGGLMDEENGEDFVVIRAVPVFEEVKYPEHIMDGATKEINEEVFHVVDIEEKEFPESLLKKLKGLQMWTDEHLSEHIYSYDELKEKISNTALAYTNLNTHEQAILRGIEIKCEKNDAAYFRIIERK